MSEIKRVACPICGKPAQADTRPFCSVRCADLDLGHWLTDSYAIPVREDEVVDEEEPSGRENVPGHGRTS